MERLLNAQLNQWRQNPKRKPLVLKGVRQCGKTWLLKEFGEQTPEPVWSTNGRSPVNL